MSHRGHRASLLGRGYDNRDADPARTRFYRAMASSFLTLVAPGSAQAFLGNRSVGRTALAFHGCLITVVVFAIWTFRNDRAKALGWMVSPNVAFWVSVLLIMGAAVWLLLFIDAWRISHTDLLPSFPRAIVTVVNMTIIMAVVLGVALTTRLLSVQRDVVANVFTATETSSPLNGRYNILLIGSDAGENRIGTRPDSLTVVSIDASSGRTVLVSIPRNLQNAKFPVDSPMHEIWPFGFNCGEECLMNAVYADANNRPGLYPAGVDAGLAATLDAVEGTTGLAINYYVQVNLQGFESLVDAVGGIEVDVQTRIAKFGTQNAYRNEWIEIGRQTLDGDEALWFARSRYGSDDYVRIARQKCLMVAMLDQLNPQTVLFNAGEIGKSSKQLLSTDMPRSELGAFADLALTARNTKIATVSLVPPAVDPVAPDFFAIHALIQEAIDKQSPISGGPTLAAPSGSADPTPSDPSESPSIDAANQTDDLDAVC